MAPRWWHFDGALGRVVRPGWRFLAGIVVFVASDALCDALADVLVGHPLASLVGEGTKSIQIRLLLEEVPNLAGTFISCLWLPWIVGLLLEDKAMTLGRVLRATPRRVPTLFVALTVAIASSYYAVYCVIAELPALRRSASA
jgi:hypothetical protein